MSTEQHPGGVAGQLLSRLEDRYKGSLPHNAERFDGQLHGASAMQEALSHEARAILADLWERVENSGDTEGVADPMLSEAYTEHGALLRGFESLGLDLESEDE